MNYKQYLAIIVFKTKAELKAERERTYLGFIWWILEPLMFLAIFYVVFSHLRHAREHFVQSVLIGLIMWQWIKSSISQSSSVIIYQINLLRQIHIPAYLFPIIKVSANTVKFIIVFLMLLLFLWVTGFEPNISYIYMIEIILIELLLINGVVLCLASIVPFVPDISVVVENLLLGLFFLSGIFFPISAVPEPFKSYLMLNPMYIIIENSREILMHNNAPNQMDMLYVFVLAIIFLSIGFSLFIKLQSKYAKLSET